MGDESAVLWLESWDDLTVVDGGTFQAGMGNFYGEDVITEGSSTWYYNVFDEDAFFADAVSVTNEEGLRKEAEDESVTVIIITGDITLTESFCQSIPMQIAEGVTVIALGTDQDLDEDGNIVSIDGDMREEEFAWHVDRKTVLINTER